MKNTVRNATSLRGICTSEYVTMWLTNRWEIGNKNSECHSGWSRNGMPTRRNLACGTTNKPTGDSCTRREMQTDTLHIGYMVTRHLMLDFWSGCVTITNSWNEFFSFFSDKTGDQIYDIQCKTAEKTPFPLWHEVGNFFPLCDCVRLHYAKKVGLALAVTRAGSSERRQEAKGASLKRKISQT